MKRTRVRMVKLFRVTREERVQVTFYVEATSALKARRTPTPDFAVRQLRGATVGETEEQDAFPAPAGGWWWPKTGRRVNRDQVADSSDRDNSRSTNE